MTIVKLILFAIIVCILYPVIKTYAPQLAPALAVGASLGTIILLREEGARLLAWWIQLGQMLNGDAFACLLKVAVSACFVDWCCNLCKENGLHSVSGCIELAGRCLMIAAALPLIQEVYTILLRLAG